MTAGQTDGQAESCAFCGIVAGRIAASVVYEDSGTVAFIDLRQPGWPRGGHLLVVPKSHVEFLFDLPDELAAHMMQTVVRVADALRKATEPGGISVWSSNGAAADQEVPHVHMHVLARHDGDRLLRVYGESPARPERAELDELAARVQASLVASTPTY
jgi:histidine triad (HIT) family protein